MFQCPEPGLYMFTLTVCTYDGKKCLLILRKNEKDVCALIDQVPCNALPKSLMITNWDVLKVKETWNFYSIMLQHLNQVCI